jgi:hypothetical protein
MSWAHDSDGRDGSRRSAAAQAIERRERADMPQPTDCAESATVGINLLAALALHTRSVYVAAMDATLTSIGEQTARAAASVCFGMPRVALCSDIAHAG